MKVAFSQSQYLPGALDFTFSEVTEEEFCKWVPQELADALHRISRPGNHRIVNGICIGEIV